MRRVAVTFIGGGSTGRHAGLDRSADDLERRLGLARDHPAHCVADVGAVETEPNAANHLRHVRLSQAGVGTARAGGRTVEALLDAAQEQLAVESDRPRLPLDDFSNSHVALPYGLRTATGCWLLVGSPGAQLV